MAPSSSKSWTRPLATVLLQTDGTDKTAKILQYSLRFIHYMLTLKKAASNKDTEKRLLFAIKVMSSSRKVIRLAKCTYSWPSIRDSPFTTDPIGLANYINNWIGNFNDILDDVAFMGNLGFLSDSTTSFSEVWADRVWFSSCFFDIFVLAVQLYHVSSQIKILRAVDLISLQGQDKRSTNLEMDKLELKKAMIWVGLWKMFGDIGVASSYALHLNTSKGNIALLGLLSASAGFYKLYVKALG